MKERPTRRRFLGAISAGAASTALTSGSNSSPIVASSDHKKPALLGGNPIRIDEFPHWPVIEDNERKSLQEALEIKKWNRGDFVDRFESSWAEKLGCPYVIATASGTAALCASLNALEVGPGDEVIVPPYTFVATINVVLLQHAIPVFVDSDRSSLQIDSRKIEAAITPSTRCIIPVHLGGNCADLDTILKIGKKREIPILEDACQAHLAEWRSQKVGTLGDLGCFSFQASKNLNCGEGGAISSRNGNLAARCASFHNAGRGYTVGKNGKLVGDRSSGFTYVRQGDNRRLTEFQGALLVEQLSRLEEQAITRESNAEYLTKQLRQIPGIVPAKMYKNCTRNAYHLYMLRYDKKQFAGLSRAGFMEALEAEGIPCSKGYGPLNREPFIKDTINSRVFRNIYSDTYIRNWSERNSCPENDHLCTEAIWFGQTQLLGPRQDMDDIANAILKIQAFAGDLVKRA